MGVALQKLAEEDPTFRVRSNVKKLVSLLFGDGGNYIWILLLIVCVVNLKWKLMLVNRKWFIKKLLRVKLKPSKYIRQTGGHGQYGHCWIKVTPQTEVGKGFEFWMK